MKMQAVLLGKFDVSTSNRNSLGRGLSLAAAICLITLTTSAGAGTVSRGSNAFPLAEGAGGSAFQQRVLRAARSVFPPAPLLAKRPKCFRNQLNVTR
jgi:hypothetical protein